MEQRQLLSEIQNRLQAAFGDRLKGVVLYGSEVRAEATEDSDIDVLVLLDEVQSHLADSRTCAGALLDLSIDLGRPIHAKPTPKNIYDEGVAPLYVEAQREGVAA